MPIVANAILLALKAHSEPRGAPPHERHINGFACPVAKTFREGYRPGASGAGNHERVVPRTTGTPRRNSAADIGFLPARCK